MAVHTVNIFTAQGHVKTWEPRQNDELTDLGIIDVCGNDSYKLCLDQNGQIFIQGMVAWMDPRSYLTPTQLTLPIPNAKVVAMSSTTELFAILLSDGSVFACGNTFSPTLVQICEKGVAQKIAVSRHKVLVSTGKTLLSYLSPSSVNTLNLGERTVRCISTYEPGFLILLDDGILYCNFQVRDLGPKIESKIDGLYIVSGFLGPQIIHMETSLDEIVCVYRDGSIVYGWADQEHTCPYPVISLLPVFPPDDSRLTHLHISRDLIWLLTDNGTVYYISKLPWLDPENGRIARFKKIPATFPKKVVHFRATWNEIYFFESGFQHKPIVTNINIESLPNRKLPFTVHTTSRGPILVDPLGAASLGLRSGDVIMRNKEKYVVVGRSGDVLCVTNALEGDGAVDVINLPDVSTILFNISLVSRPGAEIETQNDPTKHCPDFQIDRSDNGLRRICFFKYGDTVVDKHNEQYSVIGERCECLWLMNSVRGVVMCKRASCQSIHHQFKLVNRKDITVSEYKNVSGGIVLVEPVGLIAPFSIVSSPQFGIGVYVGSASFNYAILFIMDCGYCRLISHDHPIEILRTCHPFYRPFFRLDQDIQFLNVQGMTTNLMPCDVVYHSQEKMFAFCVSSAKTSFFESEEMIKNDLGVGNFDAGTQVHLAARIAYPAIIKRKLPDGTRIELSINTADFANQPLLLLDEVIVPNRKFGYICGCSNGSLYIAYEDTPNVAEPLPNDYQLIYRRLNVPTKLEVTIQGHKEIGWIDLEHFRGKGFIPYDEFEWHDNVLRIDALIDDRSVIVTNVKTNSRNVFFIPVGKYIEPISSKFS